MATLHQEIQKHLFARNWEEVIKIFRDHPELYTTKITKSEDTVLHVVAIHGAGETLVKLLDVMEEKNRDATKKALKAKNNQGDTPLHCAAARRCSANMCERILCIDTMLFVDRNNERETPLFLAALHGNKEAFLFLHSACQMVSTTNISYANIKMITPPWRRKEGETILHCTIQREYFDLAFTILHLYKDQFIADSIDEKRTSPLHVLANKPSAFQSGTRLRWWSKMLYDCVVVEPLKAPTESEVYVEVEARQIQRTTLFDKAEFPENYHTCLDFFEFLWGLFCSVIWKKDMGRNSEREAGRDSSRYENSYFPLNCATCFEFFKSSYMHIFGHPGIGLMSIKKAKQKHIWCAQIIDELIQQCSEYEWTDGGSDPTMDQSEEDELKSILNIRNKRMTDSSPAGPTNANDSQQKQQTTLLISKKDAQQEEMDKSMTALSVAAKNGVIEMVTKILDRFPVAILDRTKENKNILHVAVENRQPRIFKELKNYDIWDNLVEAVDVNGNNVLHFAAKYVKESVPQHLIFQTNKKDNTPEEIFDESHKNLVQEGGEWLKSTCNSYAAVAILIAGVSFATSTNVPGGTSDQTGKSPLQDQLAFNIFAICSLIALSFSVTQLVMFLAILTSRQQPIDFLRDLPLKLLLGLSALFVSIASTLVSFCAAYFFVLKDKLSYGVYIVYTATCLPVSFYAITQFPLYLDLLKAILTKVPQPSYKDDGI